MVGYFLRAAGVSFVSILLAPAAESQGSGRVARGHIVALSEEIGARLAGSPGEGRAALYIEQALLDAGYMPGRQSFQFAPESAARGRSLDSANVIAVKDGDSDREIIVGAHYDSEARGRGADDNASGLGVLLEVAAAIRGTPTPYTVRFVAFGAEEQGLAGSRRFVDRMSAAERRNTVAMVNLDSLIAGDYAYVYGDAGEAGVIRDWLLEKAREDGLDLRTQPGENLRYPAGTTGDFSDHAPFRRAGIPYAYFESTNWSLGEKDGYVQVDPRFGEDGYIWHTPFDNLGYIEESFPARVDQRLTLFTGLLVRLLTEFVEPSR